MFEILAWLKNKNFTESTPRYIQLAKNIEDAIMLQIIKKGDFLPAERELAKKLSVSRLTVSKAMALLEKKKYILRQQGRGTQIIVNVYSSLKTGKFSSALAQPFPKNISHQWLSHCKKSANRQIAHKLKLKPDATISFLHHIRLLNNQPLAIEWHYISENWLAAPEQINDSSYEFWFIENVAPNKKILSLTAINCTKYIAKTLMLNTIVPILKIEQITLDTNCNPIEYTIALYRSDIYQFELVL